MIKQAAISDIAVIEAILLEAVQWMEAIGQPQWKAENVTWAALSRFFRLEDFYIAYTGGTPAACMALIDHDPAFWPDVPKGEALFLHKVAVRRAYAGQGYLKAMVNFAKAEAARRGLHSLRLDCHRGRQKVRAVYEREGFVCVGEAVLFGQYEAAFYECRVHGTDF